MDSGTLLFPLNTVTLDKIRTYFKTKIIIVRNMLKWETFFVLSFGIVELSRYS